MFAKDIRSLSLKTVGYLIAMRNIQHDMRVAVQSEFIPIQIDVPWGKIEGKLWGSPSKQPILAIHGWMDNAGSFNALAPLLKNSSILAIDLPGHGLSSWLPRGIPYNNQNNVQAMRIIVKHFGWDKVKLLGHSSGGIFCYNYACLYPEEVEFVIGIDWLPIIAQISNNMAEHNRIQGKCIDKLIELEKQWLVEPPSYSEDVVIDKWMKATVFGSLDASATKTLMIRGAKQKDDGTYYYTRDARLSIRGFYSCYVTEETNEITGRIHCPFLTIKNSKTLLLNKGLYWKNIVEVLSKNSKDFRLVSLEGSHHMHMTKPELFADKINPFLMKHDV